MNYGVITVCLNSAATIARTIDSVLQQTVLPAEYIFVDGGSKDETLSIIRASTERAAHRLPYCKFTVLHQKERGGITQAWNMGLRELHTNVAFILNSDDWYDPDTAEKVLARFSEDARTEVVLGSGRYLASPDDPRPLICHKRPFAVFPFAMTVIHPATFVKKSVYERIGYFDELFKIAADYEFVYRCYKSGVRFKTDRCIMVNVLTGGLAERNRVLAAEEVRTAAKRYCSFKMLPEMAYLSRRVLRT